MSNFLVSFLVGLGSSAWVYGKMQRKNGGLTQQSVFVSALAGFAIFILLLVTLSLFM